MSFTVISTFSGCGGSSLGYKLAGGDVRLAVEWDDNAVETYRLNFPDTPIYHGDIAKLTVEECLKLSGLKPGELDILDGSPPCQGFSTAGKRNIDDDRNQLFREFVRLLDGLMPRAFVMENVSGMVKGKMRLVFVECLQALRASGYRVRARVLNAMYFNVPQSRKRLIFVGVRNDLETEPSHPKAGGRPNTFREAVRGCQRDTEERLLKPHVTIYAKMHMGGWSTDSVRWLQVHGSIAGCMSLKWASWDKPIGTITRSEISLTGIIHPDRKRYLSLSECKRCSSFPDRFKFTDRKQGIQRIGNSVPPNFMRAIAEHVQDTILTGKKAKRKR